MIQEVLEELAAAHEKSIGALRRELSRVRTGRAHAGMLDGIRVDFYGQPTPIAQMAQVTVPEPRMLMIKPWDKSIVRAIEKAIMESDLGLNPQSDGEQLRVPIPVLTEARRKELVKLCKKFIEDCKVGFRKARHDAIDTLDTMKKDGDVGEDDADRAKKKVDESTSQAGSLADQIFSEKEKEILEI